MRAARFVAALGAACISGLTSLPETALAQTYPSRPVRLVVGFPQGGPNDILGRMTARWLSDRLKQPFVVENHAGKSGNIATEIVVRAAPDGYTLLLVGPANAISGSLGQDLGFNFLRDIEPVAGITREALVMVVHPSVPAKNPTEFIALAKTKPGQLKMASTGNASSPHLSGELFKMMTGIDLQVIHYGGGGPALKAMIAGEADMMFEPLSAAIEPIRSGKLRALAASTRDRSEALPSLPVMNDYVPGYEASAATGLGAPKGTPANIIDVLNKVINAGFHDAIFKSRLLDTGGVPLPGSPADFGKMMALETEKWAKVVQFALPKTK